jgi:hypothetical protein
MDADPAANGVQGVPPRVPSAFLAALLGWLVPGLGQAYAGRPLRALYFAAVVLATFLAGLLLADFRAVSWQRERVWFVAEAFAALPTALAQVFAGDMDLVRRIPTYEVGQLYCAVASLLNLVVVGDAIGLVDEAHRARRDFDRAALGQEARAREQAERAHEALALAGSAPSAPGPDAASGSPADVPAGASDPARVPPNPGAEDTTSSAEAPIDPYATEPSPFDPGSRAPDAERAP